MLLEHTFDRPLGNNEHGTLPDLLTDLTGLTNSETSKVALYARQLLINLHQPSYERRKNHMESIFLEALEDKFSGQYSVEKLESLPCFPLVHRRPGPSHEENLSKSGQSGVPDWEILMDVAGYARCRLLAS